jgi:hypothetical protein
LIVEEVKADSFYDSKNHHEAREEKVSKYDCNNCPPNVHVGEPVFNVID